MSQPEQPAPEPGTETDDAAKPLNTRQQRFAEELAFCCLDHPYDKAVTEAYAKAGFKPHRGNAARLAMDARVQALVKKVHMDGAQLAGVHLGRVLHEFARIAFVNLDDVVVRIPGGAVVTAGKKKLPQFDWSKLTRDQMAAVAEVDAKTGVVKFHDKLGALRDLLKFTGGDNVNVKHDVSGGLADLMRAIDGRTKGLPQRQAEGSG